ncbi:hypothetical protein D3C80_1657040 [compost metagenome]
MAPDCSAVWSKAMPIFTASVANAFNSSRGMFAWPPAATIAAMPLAAIGSCSDRFRTSSVICWNCAGVSKLTTFFTSAIDDSNSIAARAPATNGAANAPPASTSLKPMLPSPELCICLRKTETFFRIPLRVGDSLSTPVINALS